MSGRPSRGALVVAAAGALLGRCGFGAAPCSAGLVQRAAVAAAAAGPHLCGDTRHAHPAPPRLRTTPVGAAGPLDNYTHSLLSLSSHLHPNPHVFDAAKRDVPLDMYRNIGIMAHIDAGKVRQRSHAFAACWLRTGRQARANHCAQALEPRQGRVLWSAAVPAGGKQHILQPRQPSRTPHSQHTQPARSQ